MLNVIVFGQCSMNCCQWGSLTPAGRDKETDGSRLCSLLWLWPDCTALFTVEGVCVCSCVLLSARLHKQMHLCHDRGRDAETICTQPSLLSRVPADGFLLSLNRRANTLMALRAAIPDTKQCRNLATVSLAWLSVPGTWTGANLCSVCISYIRMCVSAASVSALQSLSPPTHLKGLIKDSWPKKKEKEKKKSYF